MPKFDLQTRVDLSWLDEAGVQQHIIGRLLRASEDGMRALVAQPLHGNAPFRYRRAGGKLRGQAQLVECVQKGAGFIASFTFVVEAI
ncbi:MAG TPA: hypothetical protein VN776_02855 [Terracidiphilus sp.]|nr:hypothetical protein [Terracidiphilus sp.]